jgi:hypothetical protein
MSSLISEQLTTSSSVITSLRTDVGMASQYRPVLLKTSNFDQVKDWIGVPDRVFDDYDPEITIPRHVDLPELPQRELARPAAAPLSARFLDTRARSVAFSSSNLATVRAVARGYLNGDSRRLKAYKPWIEEIFPVVTISVWPFLHITVKSGSVLELGPGPNVLLAYSLTIEEGGLVRSYGDLNVDVTILRKATPPSVLPIDPALLQLRLRRQ